MGRRRRILALASYPETIASTRFRLTQMLGYLDDVGVDVSFEPFLGGDFLRDFYRPGDQARKASYLARRSVGRFASALSSTGFDGVFIQREAALVGPPYAELILGVLKRLPILFDFDDAIWELNLSQSSHPVAARALKNPAKCWSTMRRAACVVAGSSYLAEQARRVSSNVQVVPTVVSTKAWTPLPCRSSGEHFDSETPRIGWIGTHTTASQLELVAPALQRLRAEGYGFEVHVVGASEDFSLEGVPVNARPWTLESEIEEFQRIDIGLAPMFSEPVYQGKCGFKQLQYMAVGVPFVSSWVGGARDFVVDGEVGLVARSTHDWYQQIKALLDRPDLRRTLSANGLRRVSEEYSAEVQGPRLARLVADMVSAPR